MKTPSYRLVVNGQNITPKVNGRLINLTLTDESQDKADQLDITLDDSDGLLAIPPMNATIQCWLGWEGDLTYKGSFTLDEISHGGPPDQLTLRARSVNFKDTLKQKREQSYHEQTLGNILDAIASRNSLQPVITDTLKQTLIDHIDQTNESDLNLIRRLAQRYGAIGTVKNSHLLFTLAGQGKTASGKLIPTITINRQQCTNYQYSATEREHHFTGVHAYWQNTDDGEQHTEAVGTAKNPRVLRHTYPTQQEAKAAATAEWKRIQRGQETINLTQAEGNARLYTETPVILEGFKAQISGNQWSTTRVVHQMGNGFTTRLVLDISERPKSKQK